MSRTATHDFSQPSDIDRVTATRGAGRDVYDLMPAYADIPDEFKRDGNPFVRLQQKWFFEGISAAVFVAKPGIDKAKAIRHLAAIQQSWEPKHEHKEAAVAYLMSLWFEVPKD